MILKLKKNSTLTKKKWITQAMLDQETIKSALTLIGTFLILLLAVFFGWYLMWKLFLSRFRFIRELLSVEEVSGKIT